MVSELDFEIKLVNKGEFKCLYTTAQGFFFMFSVLAVCQRPHNFFTNRGFTWTRKYIAVRAFEVRAMPTSLSLRYAVTVTT